MTEAKKKNRYSRGPLWLRILAGSLTFLLGVVISFVVVSQLFASPLSEATPDNAIAQFTVAPNLNIVGQDILSPTGRIGIPNIDLSTCAAQCNNNQSCVAFSFDRWKKVCYLKNKVVAPLLDPPSLTAVKNGTIPNKSKAPFKIETLPNHRFPGKPNRHTRASDYLACMAACKDDENCVAFSFLKDVGTTDNCQIFENPEQGHVADPSIDSGYKYQIRNTAALPPLAPPAAPKGAPPPVATQAAPKEAPPSLAPQAAREEAQAELAPATPVTPHLEERKSLRLPLRLRDQLREHAPLEEHKLLREQPLREHELLQEHEPRAELKKLRKPQLEEGELLPPPERAGPVLRGSPSTTPTAALPDFPWPPPASSGSYVLPDNLLQNRRTVGEAVTDIISALELNGYVERSFFQTETGGVALVTRLERINDDGSPVVGPQRWSVIAEHPGSTADLINFLRGLFFIDPGHYRVIVFILQDLPFSQSSRTISKEEASAWLTSGFNILPSSIAERPFTPGGHCTVLVYEFASDGSTVHVITSGLTGKQHLEKAGVLSRLGNVN
jgi:hypothetical protein